MIGFTHVSFVSPNFHNFLRKKWDYQRYKGFLFGKMGPSHHVIREQKLKLPYLNIKFQQVAAL
jgi:hypothetical protein